MGRATQCRVSEALRTYTELQEERGHSPGQDPELELVSMEPLADKEWPCLPSHACQAALLGPAALLAVLLIAS